MLTDFIDENNTKISKNDINNNDNTKETIGLLNVTRSTN